jgi:hypothetical protein
VWIRRLVISALTVVLVFVVAACTTSGRGDLLPMSGASAPAPTPDRTVTDHVCRAARGAVSTVSSVFNKQLDVIDEAAAAGDQASIMKAADTIQIRLLALADSLASWGAERVPAPVRTALSGGAATLRAICAESYSGNQTDIARQLGLLSRSLTRACG